MRVLAIGDIHGCSRALDALLKVVNPESSDHIITLGDYVDRGPDSSGTIQRLIRLNRINKLVALRGNHELMMLNARKDGDTDEWLRCGGRETLMSYSVLDDEGKLVDVPDEH